METLSHRAKRETEGKKREKARRKRNDDGMLIVMKKEGGFNFLFGWTLVSVRDNTHKRNPHAMYLLALVGFPCYILPPTKCIPETGCRFWFSFRVLSS